MPAGYRTPEEAARGSIPAQFVQPIGVVIRGDRAIVAQLMNDGPPFEVETSHCHREADGSWTEGMSSNSTSGFLAGGDGQGTAVVWDVAPDKAVAARFVYDRREQVAVVEHGCAIAVFDDVPDENRWLLDGPSSPPGSTPTGSRLQSNSLGFGRKLPRTSRTGGECDD